MNVRSSLVLPASKAAALALAFGLVSFAPSSASAQWLRYPEWDSAMPPMRIERAIQASGYRLTGPLMRNGGVYVATVLGGDGDLQRLIIDAHDGQLLQRYAISSAERPHQAAGGWTGLPRFQSERDEAWLDRDDDFGAPRPPAAVYGDANRNDPSALSSETIQRLRGTKPDEVARADESSGSPYVILAPPAAATHDTAPLEKPKPKVQVKHRKPEPTPVALPQPTVVPGDVKATAATQPSTEPTPSAGATPAVTVNPGVGATPRTDTAATAASPPRVADTKPVPSPTAEAVPTTPAGTTPSKPAKPSPQ